MNLNLLILSRLQHLFWHLNGPKLFFYAVMNHALTGNSLASILVAHGLLSRFSLFQRCYLRQMLLFQSPGLETI